MEWPSSQDRYVMMAFYGSGSVGTSLCVNMQAGSSVVSSISSSFLISVAQGGYGAVGFE